MRIGNLLKSARFTSVLAWTLSFLLICSLLASYAPPATATPNTWTLTGSLVTGRDFHTTTLLPNGKVLVAGGRSGSGLLASAELYDPATGVWSPTGSMNAARFCHTATLLPNGKVLVAGGGGASGIIASAELYDPATGTWSYTGAMRVARHYQTATLLPNGKVLVVGGYNHNSGSLGDAELYDPSTRTWSDAAGMSIGRTCHTATLLANGKVLVVGGEWRYAVVASAELYDPAANTWTATGAMHTVRYLHTATLLSTGQVLVAGGQNGSGTPFNSAELYDPATGTWSMTGSMSGARDRHSATLLADGRVLVAGGYGDANYSSLVSAELYDPVSRTWNSAGTMYVPLACHTATLLANGRVLVAGGSNLSGYQASAELYDPGCTAWTLTGSMSEGRNSSSVTLLLNGKVLVAAGSNIDASVFLKSAELYDPATGAWSMTGSMSVARYEHPSLRLPDGRVLVAGGYGNGSCLSSAELYDPATGTWSATGNMSVQRFHHTMTLLPNGRVLVVGGHPAGGINLASAELYDPASGTWSAAGTMSTARVGHTATLLPNGKVLVAGGAPRDGQIVASAEIYDPAANTWSTVGSMHTARYLHEAVLLSTGQVLITGGKTTGNPFNSAELYDPATGAWTVTGSLDTARCQFAMTRLASGQVLVAGGFSDAGYGRTSSAELYDPASGTWSSAGAMNIARGFESDAATLLSDGRYMVVADSGAYQTFISTSAELYDPSACAPMPTPTPTNTPLPTPTPTNTATPTPRPTSACPLVEEFDSATGFTTDPAANINIANGQANWSVCNAGDRQFIYRSIPSFSGDVRLTVRGMTAAGSYNCLLWAGIGDAPGTGISVMYMLFGGGCPIRGPMIWAWGVDLGGPNPNTGCASDGCSMPTSCQWWVPAQVPFEATIEIRGNVATFYGDGGRYSEGVPVYTGQYNTLYVGSTGGGDWPCCSGTIDYIKVEPLGECPTAPTPTYTPTPTPTSTPVPTSAPPALSNVVVTSPINEGDTATLSGNISDPDAQDVFTLVVDWGDGSALETFHYPAGTTSFGETHRYVDDNPSGTPSDVYTIQLTLSDGVQGGWREIVLSTVDPFPWTADYIMAAGDADNDGATEVTLGSAQNFVAPKIEMYDRSGDSWTGSVIASGGSEFNAVAGTEIGDADNDGHNELVYSFHKQGNVNGGAIYLSRWNGATWTVEPVFADAGDWAFVHAIANLDGDAPKEIIASVDTYGFGETWFEPWLFERVGSSWTHASMSSSRLGDPPQMQPGDFDGDGTVELARLKMVSSNGAYYQVVYSVIDWTGVSWQETEVSVLPPNTIGLIGGWQSAMAVGDLDEDGRDEFVVAYWLDSDGDGVREAGHDQVVIRMVGYDGSAWNSVDIASFPRPGTLNIYALAVGDANNDGQAEIYLAGEDGLIRVYAPAADGWAESQIPSSFALPWYRAIVVDVDNDGYKDLLLVGREQGGAQFALVAYSGAGAVGDQATASVNVTVVNLPPTVGTISAPIDPQMVNTTINTSTTFADTGTLDTHTALWNWGGEVTSAGAVAETNGSGTVSGSHIYITPGVYTINLKVTDDDTGVGDAPPFQYVVIYDPDGGFVTGGGWIMSPAGAYVPNPALTGKATFGFVAKYNKGATVPTGNTEFQFHVANLNFKSASYDWLVVAGAKAQYKGLGTINGAGEYGFLLTAIDGQVNGGGGVDKFRIKITDKASGALIYDNLLDAPDDADPTTALGGGSIVIHK